MSSLRRQAMDHRKHDEFGKTISRKARARLDADSSPLRSLLNSRSGSRVPSNDGSRPGSRHASVPSSRVGSRLPSPSRLPDHSDFAYETADNSLSDDEEESTGIEKLVQDMKDRTFWKGASADRLRIVRTFANALCRSPEDHPSEITETLPVLIRCLLKDSVDVAQHASRAIGALAIFSGSLDIFSAVESNLQSFIVNSISTEAKETALRAYGVAAYFGGTDVHQVTTVMDFFIEIIKSDGESINALDNPEVVCAAILGWSFLSTLRDPDELAYYDAVEAFEDQLQSSVPSVLMTAANGIGLIAEEQYGPQELDSFGNSLITDEYHAASEDSDDMLERTVAKKYRRSLWTQNYDLLQDRVQPIKDSLAETDSSSMRRTKKESRKEIHHALRDALQAIEKPWRGPRFSTALDGGEKLRMLGHRLTKSGILMNRWWKMIRYDAIKQVVQGGMQEYIDTCAKVKEALTGDSMVGPSRFKVSEVYGETDEMAQNVPEWPVDERTVDS